MKNSIQLLKKIACATGIVLLTAGGANAQLVYQTDFSGTYADNTGNTILGGDGTLPDIGTENFFGSPENLGSENLTLALEAPASSGNRYRGSGVWLDASTWAAGTVTVEVEVANFLAVGVDKFMIFQAYAANGVDALNSVGLDLHAGFNAGPQLGVGGTRDTIGTAATIVALGDEQAIDASGTVQFTFDYNGTDQFIALTLAQRLRNGTDLTGWTGTADLDNLTVTVGGGPVVIKGDVNMDGVVDFGDIGPFIGVLQAGTFQAEADVDCSTEVNFGDIGPFIGILQGN